jgi:hypothetical protein
LCHFLALLIIRFMLLIRKQDVCQLDVL